MVDVGVKMSHISFNFVLRLPAMLQMITGDVFVSGF